MMGRGVRSKGAAYEESRLRRLDCIRNGDAEEEHTTAAWARCSRPFPEGSLVVRVRRPHLVAHFDVWGNKLRALRLRRRRPTLVALIEFDVLRVVPFAIDQHSRYETELAVRACLPLLARRFGRRLVEVGS